MEKKSDIIKFTTDKIIRMPEYSIGNIGKEGLEIIKLVVDGYNQREAFRLQMVASNQFHQDVMMTSQAISDYRTMHLSNLTDVEKIKLTDAFCKKMLNQL